MLVKSNPREKVAARLLDEVLAELENNQGTLETSLEKGQSVDLKPQLETILWLSRHRNALEPRPEFIECSRIRLVNKIKSERVSENTWTKNLKDKFSGMGSYKRQAVKVAYLLPVLLMFLVVLSRGISAVEKTALPGDVLYPIKEMMEITQLNLTFSQIGRIAFHIQMAGERLSEIQILMMVGREDLIPATIEEFEREIDLVLTGLTPLARTHPEEFDALSKLLDERVTKPLEAVYLLGMEYKTEVTADLVDVVKVVLARLNDLDAIEKGIGSDSTPTEFPIKSSTWIPFLTPTPTLYRPSATLTLEYPASPTQTESAARSDEDQKHVRVTKTAKPGHTPKPTNTYRPDKVPPEKSKDERKGDK